MAIPKMVLGRLVKQGNETALDSEDRGFPTVRFWD